ncbi:putative map kinase kinase kinase win1 [Diplodia seriata]|uniref:EKC/KEOPS complex subunit BUD32 n=1 Tax=Diplodia seriata TaxID=420778 RepID=A0A0G2DRQ0_9PEZI|nr:putative map kinase kinase kinase win1 [Diplodia seriata]
MQQVDLRVGGVIGRGGTSKVYEVTYANGDTLAMKTASEMAAYDRITTVGELRDRVPRYYGVTGFPPCSILLEKLDGVSLQDAIKTLPLEKRDEIMNEVTKTLHLLHRDAGLCHGDIRPKNILIQNGVPKLLDFGSATLKPAVMTDQDEEDWKYDTLQDLTSLRVIFWERTSEESHEQALAHVERMRQDPDYRPEPTLATLLSRIGDPSVKLLDSITDLIESPSPDLALALAEHLATRGKWSQATGLVLEMKEAAARYAAEQRLVGSELEPSTTELFNGAIDYYLHSSPGRDDADEKVLKLRFELAEALSDADGESGMVQVCEEALEKAMATNKKVSEDLVRDFRKLLEGSLKGLGTLMTLMERYKLHGTEKHQRPWSKMPEYQSIYKRMEQAMSLCDALLLGQELVESLV